MALTAIHPGEHLAEELKELGVKTLALGCDVKDPASVQAAVDETLSRFGRIDVLINNAGISWGAPTETMSLADWNKVIETNLTGSFLCSQAVGKHMIANQRGKIKRHEWTSAWTKLPWCPAPSAHSSGSRMRAGATRRC